MPSADTARDIDVVLFDLGGVLIELAGVGKMLEDVIAWDGKSWEMP